MDHKNSRSLVVPRYWLKSASALRQNEELGEKSPISYFRRKQFQNQISTPCQKKKKIQQRWTQISLSIIYRWKYIPQREGMKIKIGEIHTLFIIIVIITIIIMTAIILIIAIITIDTITTIIIASL